jgi:FHA domain/Domain of unknown function (DUF4388)
MARRRRMRIVGPGIERELTPGGRLRLGRHSSNEIVLPDRKVSRFHASIVWPPAGEPIVRDDGSNNGVQIDGDTIEGPQSLQDGSLLRLGDYVLKIEISHEPASEAVIISPGGQASAASGDSDEAEGMHSAALVLSSQEPLDLEGPLPGAQAVYGILLDLEQGRRSGTLRLELGDKEGVLTFLEGRLTSAEYAGVQGVPALELVLDRQQGGVYRFRSNLARGAGGGLDLSMVNFMRRNSSSKTTSRFPNLHLLALESGKEDDEATEDLQTVDLAGSAPPEPRGTIRGTFEAGHLRGVLAMLEVNGQSGALRVTSPPDQGTIYFEEGRVVGGSMDSLSGVHAARAVARKTEGAFVFQPHLPLQGRQIESLSVAELLELS